MTTADNIFLAFLLSLIAVFVVVLRQHKRQLPSRGASVLLMREKLLSEPATGLQEIEQARARGAQYKISKIKFATYTALKKLSLSSQKTAANSMDLFRCWVRILRGNDRRRRSP
jgi:hypothetical protein